MRLGNESGWRGRHFSEYTLQYSFNFQNHANVSYSLKKGNEDREKTKVDNKQKQISLTVFQMNTTATLKGGYIQKN